MSEWIKITDIDIMSEDELQDMCESLYEEYDRQAEEESR